MENSLEGKNIIVTGANCGIGYETALELAKRGIFSFFFNSKNFSFILN